jgi:hypothetical protein
MCVIVDANMAAEVFAKPASADMAPILRWLLRRDGVLVHDRKLARELSRVDTVRRTLVALRQAGKAIDVEGRDPEAFAKELQRCQSLCKSNDAHVAAVACASGARTLVTRDGKLMDNFRDTKIVPPPKGKIYQRAEHASLLAHTRGCCAPKASGKRRR